MRHVLAIFSLLLAVALIVMPRSFHPNALAQGQKPAPAKEPGTVKNPPQSGEEDPVALTDRTNQPVAPSRGDELGPDQFGTFHGPQINNRGEVAFIGRFTQSRTDSGVGQGIFIRKPDGEYLYVTDGTKIPTSEETLKRFSLFGFNEAGGLIFTAEFEPNSNAPKSATTSNAPFLDRAARVTEKDGGIVSRRDGVFSVIARLNEDVPNMPSRFSSFSNPSMNSKGVIAFIAAYVDPDGRGLFISEGGKLRIIARSGQRIGPNRTEGFSEHYYPSRINERNEIAFLSRVGGGSGIFVSRPSGVELIAIDGTPTPIKGAKWLGFGNRAPAINNNGDVVFAGFYDGPNAARALFVKPEKGPIRLLLRSGLPYNNLTFSDFNYPAINARGDVVFWGRREGRVHGIFLKTAKGVELIAQTDDLLPGMKKGEEFSSFHIPEINDHGDVVFYAQLRNSSVGIFIKDAKGLRPFVMRGQKTPIK